MHSKLITALRTAVEKGDGTLDKEATSHDDLIDTFRLSMLDQKLLISSNTGPNQHYEITPNGIRFLEIFTEIEDSLRPVNNVTSKHLSISHE